jgi:hypothetical protein
MDEDQSGFLLLGEVLTFTYRSEELQKFLAFWPSEQQEIFEDLIDFWQGGASHARAILSTADGPRPSTCVRSQLKTSPDPGRRNSLPKGTPLLVKKTVGPGGKSQTRGFKAPSTVKKSHAWVMWKVFDDLAGETRVIHCQALSTLLGNQQRLMKFLNDEARTAHKYDKTNQNMDDDERPDVLVLKLSKFLTSSEALKRLEKAVARGEKSLSLRGFFCVFWWFVAESELEACLGWCRCFYAQVALHDLCSAGSSKIDAIAEEDVLELFRAIDVDGSGSVTVDELCRGGSPGGGAGSAAYEAL